MEEQSRADRQSHQPTAEAIAAAYARLQGDREAHFLKLERWALLLTAVMAISTVVSVMIARDQWQQLRLQNAMIEKEHAATTRSAKLVTRAYITFASLRIDRYTAKRDRVTMTLSNVGQTPAYIGDSHVGLVYYRKGELTAAVRQAKLQKVSLFGSPVGAGDPFRRTLEFDVDPAQRKVYESGNGIERLVVAILHYKDIYGDARSYIACPFRNREWDRMDLGPRVVNCQDFFPALKRSGDNAG